MWCFCFSVPRSSLLCAGVIVRIWWYSNRLINLTLTLVFPLSFYPQTKSLPIYIYSHLAQLVEHGALWLRFPQGTSMKNEEYKKMYLLTTVTFYYCQYNLGALTCVVQIAAEGKMWSNPDVLATSCQCANTLCDAERPCDCAARFHFNLPHSPPPT